MPRSRFVTRFHAVTQVFAALLPKPLPRDRMRATLWRAGRHFTKRTPNVRAENDFVAVHACGVGLTILYAPHTSFEKVADALPPHVAPASLA